MPDLFIARAELLDLEGEIGSTQLNINAAHTTPNTSTGQLSGSYESPNQRKAQTLRLIVARKPREIAVEVELKDVAFPRF